MTPFQDLHAAGCFVLPNAWDAGSAVLLHRLGFAALASTSAGFAFSRGVPDGPGGVGLDDQLAHLRELVAATALPVNADFQNGYADEPAQVAQHVTRCAATGVAGLSIEDWSGSALYDETHAVERIQAARSALDSSVVLTVRCEARLVGHPDADRVVLDRLVAFAAAGADCLYAPGLTTVEQVLAVVSAVAPLPVNILVGELGILGPDGPLRSVAALADLGVRRLSLGSVLARAAWGGFLRAARPLAEQGSFAGLDGAEPYGWLNDAFTLHTGHL